MPTCSATQKWQPLAFRELRPKIPSEHRTKIFLVLYTHQHASRTVRSSVRLPNSPQPLQPRMALKGRWPNRRCRITASSAVRRQTREVYERLLAPTGGSLQSHRYTLAGLNAVMSVES